MKLLFALPVLLAAFSSSQTASPTALGDHDWVVDTGHSSVMFKIKHANAANFYGSFEQISGSISLDPAAPATGTVKLTIPVDSVRTRDEGRDKHLKGPDFFNGKENPDITFVSTTIKGVGEGKFEAIGELELAGEKQTVTMTVTKVGEGEFRGPRLGYETNFKIERSKFGMNYGVAQNVLGDEVTVLVSLELVKPK